MLTTEPCKTILHSIETEVPYMKFATCNEYFENWEVEDVFSYAADLGYDGVEIAPFTIAPSVEDISAQRRDKIRAAAERSGVEIVGLHWLLASPEGLYITHPDQAIYERTKSYFKRYFIRPSYSWLKFNSLAEIICCNYS